MTGKLAYYLSVSYRRKRVDADLLARAGDFKGRVLDIGGGRRRGRFAPPPDTQWIVVDVSAEGRPGVRGDVQALPFRDRAFDAVKATEVLEHVPNTACALAECRRVLRPEGRIVITAPFLERLHGDPHDYARFTREMWERLLAGAQLRPVAIEPQGAYFSHLAGLLRFLVLRAPAGLRHAGYALFPLFDLLARLDRSARVQRSEFASFVGGWLIIAIR